jgi:aminopeptidase N
MRKILPTLVLLLAGAASAAPAQDAPRFTRADTLRGSVTPQRAWWDVTFYDLHVRVNPADSSVAGRNGITYRVLRPAQEMQIDLQEPMQVDSMVQDGHRLAYRREGGAFFATLASPQRAGESRTVTVHYRGKPRAAQNAPWDGGFVWAKDTVGNRWVATAVQGLGASAWWPVKDHQTEEPDSQRIAVTVPDPMVNVSNGRLRSTTRNRDGTTTYEWFVKSPINNYDVAVNAGTYAHFSDTYQGERGSLTLDYWPLAVNLERARVQFRQVKPMLKCFEHWFGPFPWYEDGFKLVETPHLGMEHQSAIAYGNKYQNGYLGRDRSGTGHGMKWDFIVIHESGHEWWGNHVTSKDIADMWVHESFTNYSEALYTECTQGREAGFAYARGGRRNVQNEAPIVGVFGVHNEGSGDMYDKGGLMLHTIRQLIGNDETWRGILRGLNSTYGRKTVTGQEVQEYISRESGIDLSRVFRQYLTTTMVPVLEYRIQGSTLSYRWTNVIPGFDMPVKATLSGDAFSTIRPTTAWQTARVSLPSAAAFRVDPNFYVDAKNVGTAR